MTERSRHIPIFRELSDGVRRHEGMMKVAPEFLR